MQLQNNTGTIITDLSISFDYEKYRSGSRAFDLTFQVSTDGSSFGSGIAAGNQSYTADAANTTVYNPPTTISKTVTLTGVNIANGPITISGGCMHPIPAPPIPMRKPLA